MALLAGWIGTLGVGVSLGVMGGGGSILTVPILVYLFGLPVTEATASSLVLVGITSLAGAVAQARQGAVDLRVALPFALPSLVTAYVTRRFLLPALPQAIAIAPGLTIARDRLLMLLFAGLIVAAATRMLAPARDGGQAGRDDEGNRRDRRDRGKPQETGAAPRLRLVLAGSIVGALAGLFGAGGGFLIIPALVLLTGLSMKSAIGTSLAIIALQSAAGIAGAVGAQAVPGWTLLIRLTLVALVGMAAGLRLGRRLPGARLRRLFGGFILTVGAAVLLGELLALA